VVSRAAKIMQSHVKEKKPQLGYMKVIMNQIIIIAFSHEKPGKP